MSHGGSHLFVSLATVWELAIKSSKGKLEAFGAMIASRPLEFVLSESGFTLLNISLDHVAMAHRLPFHHRDPFDRMLVAQAMAEDLTVITSDRTFGQYADLRILAA